MRERERPYPAVGLIDVLGQPKSLDWPTAETLPQTENTGDSASKAHGNQGEPRERRRKPARLEKRRATLNAPATGKTEEFAAGERTTAAEREQPSLAKRKTEA